MPPERDRLTYFLSPALMAELLDVLARGKFAVHLRRANLTADQLVLEFATPARVVQPVAIEPVIQADPDDDEFCLARSLPRRI